MLHVTPGLLEPVTLAAKLQVLPCLTPKECGEMVTETLPGAGVGVGGGWIGGAGVPGAAPPAQPIRNDDIRTIRPRTAELEVFEFFTLTSLINRIELAELQAAFRPLRGPSQVAAVLLDSMQRAHCGALFFSA